ncbi:MAG: hypothetical protein LBQ50_07010, partial [Planctomycetaceae bacterium]|nr:hypothetical protein [Planctomycetaceae bacterium]
MTAGSIRWSDFEYQNSEQTLGIFQTRGKTGKHCVSLFYELISHLEKLRKKRNPDQIYVFDHYHDCKNIGKIIGDYMGEADLKVWDKFFINLRASFTTDREREEMKDSVLDAILG